MDDRRLVAVVLLAKKLAPDLEAAVARTGAPDAIVGVVLLVVFAVFLFTTVVP